MLIWAGIISSFFLWQAFSYAGIVNKLAEWQFHLFEKYYPVITYSLVIIFFSLPLLIVISILAITRKKRPDQHEDAQDPAQGAGQTNDQDSGIAETEAEKSVHSARRLRRFLAWASACMVLFAVISVGLSFLVPEMRGPIQQITLERGQRDPVNPREGYSAISGAIDGQMAARFGENMTLDKQYIYFAPIRSSSMRQGAVRYFTEIIPTGDRAKPFDVPAKGILRRNALPGEIEQLYLNIGMKIDKPYYVLYTSPSPVKWRYYRYAMQFGLIAALFAIFAYLERRRIKKLLKQIEEEQSSGASPETQPV